MKKIFMLLLLLFILGLMTSAKAAEVSDELTNAAGLDELQQAAEGYMDEVPLNTKLSLNDGIPALAEKAKNAMSGIIRGAVSSGVKLMVIVLLCGLAEGIEPEGAYGTIRVVSLLGALAVTTVAASDIRSLLGMGREAIDSISGFSKALLPTMSTVTAMGGAPASAAARQLATLLFSDMLITAIDRLLLPMLYLYIALCAAKAAVGNDGLKRVAGTIKSLIVTFLAVLLLTFVGYLTVSGVIAGSTDAVTVKAAKFTISSMIPVVGGILSDAAETVLAGAAILKGAVGVFGMLTVLSICLVPFISLGIQYLTYKIAAALSATVGAGPVVGLIDGIGEAFALMMGMTGACALILLISMVSGISMVTS